jgi:hypothetical protein
MAIKIPSKNIYNFDKSVSQYTNNKFSATINKYQPKAKNILPQTYDFEFSKISIDTKNYLVTGSLIGKPDIYTQGIQFESTSDERLVGTINISLRPYFLLGNYETSTAHKFSAKWAKVNTKYGPSGMGKPIATSEITYIEYNDSDLYSLLDASISNYNSENFNANLTITFPKHFKYLDRVENGEERFNEMFLVSAKVVAVNRTIYEHSEEEISVGNGNSVFQNDTNELLSEDFIHTLTQQNSKYSRGIISMELLCSIDNYYDYETNEVKISVDNNLLPMVFRKHDEVVPMFFNAEGNEVPLSLNKDGSPKKFLIVGTEKYYDGAVWQKISLQEV